MMMNDAELITVTAGAYAAELNASTKAWVAESPSTRFALLLVEEQAFWASHGIVTGLDLAQMLDAEQAKEERKASYASGYEHEPVDLDEDPMSREDGWFI